MPETRSTRRYVAVVQAAEGYPAPGAPLESAPPDGPAPPVLHSVVLADEYEALAAEAERLRAALTRIEAGGSTFLYDGAGCAHIAADALTGDPS
jgi:hypothetical protein